MRRVVVAIGGVTVVALYATLMAVQALVLDPLAAMPGLTMDQIHADVRESGGRVGWNIAIVIITAAFGVGLAVIAGVFGQWKRLSPLVEASIFLGIVTLGAVANFYSGFALRMDVADAYGISGRDYTVWPGVLYVTSLVALVALIPVLVIIRLHPRAARSVAAAGD